MGDVSKQFSLREIIGNVAPGAMVLSAILWVWLKLGELPGSLSGWTGLLIGFVLAYGAGSLLTSLTQNVFATVTQSRTAAAPGPAGIHLPSLRIKQPRISERIYRRVDKLAKRAVSYLSGGQDIASGIREFRESWERKAAEERVVSAHALALAARHYRALFDAEPAGEESLLFCELYVRDRMPSAMLEIEQNAAKAALMGNLILPMLCWLIAVGMGILLPLFGDHTQHGMIRTVLELAVFGILLVLFPYLMRMIGRQWIEASRNHVRILVLTFTIACRLAASGSKPSETKASVGAA